MELNGHKAKRNNNQFEEYISIVHKETTAADVINQTPNDCWQKKIEEEPVLFLPGTHADTYI